jgi:hypothetical protein
VMIDDWGFRVAFCYLASSPLITLDITIIFVNINEWFFGQGVCFDLYK